MDHDTKYYRKPWMDAGQWECAVMVAQAFGGFHHLDGPIREEYRGISVPAYAHRLATFDFNKLTELVFAAHDRCIRLAIEQSSPRKVRLLLHKRTTREGGMCIRHPTLEQAVADWRKHNPVPKEPTP